MRWEPIEQQLDAILKRRWYTNHGPMAAALEARCCTLFAATHAIIATNPTIALIMLLDALGVSGEVLISPLAPARCAQAISWAGLTFRIAEPLRGKRGHGTSALEASIGPQSGALLCTPDLDEAACAALAAGRGLAFLGDGTEGEWGPRMITLPCFGDDAAVACLLTDDGQLAARLRNIRSSYGAGPPVAVTRTANGRVSEAQAAMALLMLDETEGG